MSISHQPLNLWGRVWIFIHTRWGSGKQLSRKPSLGSFPIPLSSSLKRLLLSRLPACLLHSWLRMSPLHEKTEAVWPKLTMFLPPPSRQLLARPPSVIFLPTPVLGARAAPPRFAGTAASCSATWLYYCLAFHPFSY